MREYAAVGIPAGCDDNEHRQRTPPCAMHAIIRCLPAGAERCWRGNDRGIDTKTSGDQSDPRLRVSCSLVDQSVTEAAAGAPFAFAEQTAAIPQAQETTALAAATAAEATVAVGHATMATSGSRGRGGRRGGRSGDDGANAASRCAADAAGGAAVAAFAIPQAEEPAPAAAPAGGTVAAGADRVAATDAAGDITATNAAGVVVFPEAGHVAAGSCSY